MDLHLKDKVFIVTGGAKGIGEAIVLELANEVLYRSFSIGQNRPAWTWKGKLAIKVVNA